MKNNPCIASLIGTWFIDGLPYGEEGILVITPEFRVVQFPTSITLPHLRQTQRLWASNDGDNQIRFKWTPSSEGWLRRVELNEFGWTMIAIQDGSEHRFECRHAAIEQLPEWFHEELEKNLRQMAETEAKPQETR